MKTKFAIISTSLALVSLLAASPALADDGQGQAQGGFHIFGFTFGGSAQTHVQAQAQMEMRPGMGVFGTVSAINGTTLTITSKMPMRGEDQNASTTAVAQTYT